MCVGEMCFARFPIDFFFNGSHARFIELTSTFSAKITFKLYPKTLFTHLKIILL